jgi:transcriptional regulator with XRE-family HTH domain
MGHMAHIRPSRTGVRRSGSGIGIDPEKLGRQMAVAGLDRLQLAARIGEVSRSHDIRTPQGEHFTLSRDSVAKWLNGERHPKPHTFQALCVALGCEPDVLLRDLPGDRDEMEKESLQAAGSLKGFPFYSLT